MYLVDTNVVSEARKQSRADPGVLRFFEQAAADSEPLYLSVVTIGELRCGIERVRSRGDARQAARLEAWLESLLNGYGDCILDFDAETAQIWGGLMAPAPSNALDKQIAATALIYGLTVVTRNERHFSGRGIPVLNPFCAGS